MHELFGKAARVLTAMSWAAITLALVGAVLPLLFILYFGGLQIAGSGSAVWTNVGDPRHLQALVNSTSLAVLTAGGLTIFGGMSALLFRWCGLTGSRFIYTIAVVPLLVPDQVLGVMGRAVLDPSGGVLAGVVAPGVLSDRWSGLMLVWVLVMLKWGLLMVALADASILKLGRPALFQIQMDFGSYFAAIRRVYLRQLRPALLVIASLGVLVGFRQHELAYELTSGGGGFQTETWSHWNYRVLFSFADIGGAAVQAVVVLVLLLVPILLIRREAMELWRRA